MPHSFASRRKINLLKVGIHIRCERQPRKTPLRCRGWLKWRLGVFLTLLVTLSVPITFNVWANRVIILVSINSAGTAGGNNYSYQPSISADGRYVAFSSQASNLTANDTNFTTDVFVRDTQTNTTTLVSVNSAGTASVSSGSYDPSISADGRFVAFWSYASNLTANDINSIPDVFVRDTQTNTTSLVSVNSAGTASGNSDSYLPSISADGRYVAFRSFASNLTANDTNDTLDVFVRDLQSRTTTLVSVNSAGTASGNGASYEPSISADGRYVAFWSDASNLVANDTNSIPDVFVRDLQSGTTTLVSVNGAGMSGGNGGSNSSSISADGRYVAFFSFASNLTANDTNDTLDVFVRDLQSRTTTLVSVNSAGTASGNGASYEPSISADGRYVAFWSDASNLVANDTNGYRDVFISSIESNQPCTLPRILNQPRGTTVLNNESATLKVETDTAISPTFQWYKGDSGDTSQKIEGATSDSLTINSVAANSRTNYWAQLTNSCGTTNSTTTTVVAIDKLPLIFVPGIAGSRLANADGTEIWAPPDKDGFANPFSPTGFTALSLDPSSFPHPKIVAPDVIRIYEQETDPAARVIYHSLLAMLVNPSRGGYREYRVRDKPELRTFDGCDLTQSSDNPTLFVFAYDWRKGNEESASALKEYVRCVQRFYPNTDIDIVAHSQGGLVSRRYILDHPNDNYVNKLTTIASPWLGAPKAINVLETGRFLDASTPIWLKDYLIDPIRDKTTNYIFKTLTEFYPGVHQLVPSKAYFDYVGQASPYNHNGKALNYDQAMNLLDQQFQKSKPGTIGRRFHELAGQDDWSDASKPFNTNIEYHHLYGIKRTADTVGTVVRNDVTSWSLFGGIVTRSIIDLIPVSGDQTVPVFSARRNDNLNAPGVTLGSGRIKGFYCKSGCDVRDFLYSHTGLVSNAEVQAEILRILQSPKQTASSLQSTNEVNTQPATEDVDEPEIQPAYYLRAIGATSAAIQDASGSTTDPLADPPNNNVPTVSSYLLGEQSFLAIVPLDQTYTITLRSGADPIVITLIRGTDTATTQAVRYLDVNLPANTKVKLELSPSGIGALQYDGDGDGVFESTVQPTASVTGNAAQDTQAPTIGVNEVPLATTRRVTITATDEGAGVRSVFYSLDGTNFQPYNGAFEINPTQTTTVYAFAEDNVANRSSLVTYSVKKRRKGRVRRGSRDGF